MNRLTNAEAVRMLVDSKMCIIRDLSDPEQKPFQYSSGWFGPGYLLVKGLVGQKQILKALLWELANRMVEQNVHERIDFVAANATGGMIPGWILSEMLGEIVGREVPYVYVRNTRKIGGTAEYVTGSQGNSDVQPGTRGLVVEELVNFADTTCNSAIVLRQEGFTIGEAGTIFYYANPKADERISEVKLSMTCLVTLPEFLDVVEAERLFPEVAIKDYRDYLSDPEGWNNAKGYKRVVPE